MLNKIASVSRRPVSKRTRRVSVSLRYSADTLTIGHLRIDWRFPPKRFLKTKKESLIIFCFRTTLWLDNFLLAYVSALQNLFSGFHGKILDNKDTPRINLFKVMLRPVLKCPYFLGMLITVASYQLSIRISTEISKSFCVTTSRIILFNFPYCTPHSHRSFKCQRWVFLYVSYIWWKLQLRVKEIVVFWCRGRAQSPNDVIEKAGWRLNNTLTDCAT